MEFVISANMSFRTSDGSTLHRFGVLQGAAKAAGQARFGQRGLVMSSLVLRSLKALGIMAVCFIAFFAIFLLLPTIAHAEGEATEDETAQEETSVSDEAPIEEGSASIGDVTVTDGSGSTTVDTQPELQDALGAEAGDSLEYENTAASNAIQQAIDAALSYASNNLDITSLTIVVEDGTYSGGLTIGRTHTVTTTDEATGETTTSEETYNLAEGFVLRLVAADAKADDGTLTNSAGGAGLGGNVNIDNLNVIIAGLYFAVGGVVNARSGNVSIYGTAKDDTIHVDLANGATATIDAGDGNDDILLSGTLGTQTGSDGKAVTVNGGAGDDVVTVDTSTALDTAGKVSVGVDGGEGADRLHLTGTLKQGGVNTASRTGDTADITLTVSELKGIVERALDIDAAGVEAYTDALSGKTRVVLSGASGDLSLTGVSSFTDYIIEDYDGGNLTVGVPAGATPMFASLVLSGGDVFDIGSVYAPALNVVAEGKGITVKGTVTARNIALTAANSDVAFSLSTDFAGGLLPDYEMNFSLFDFVSKAYIIIEAGAALIASETVTLLVTSSQTEPLMPDASELAELIKGLEGSANDASNPNRESDAAMLAKLEDLAVNPNFINVKVGSAIITILGTVSASQAVRASASTTTSMEVTNEDIAKWCIPLGISVAVAKAEIVLGGSASVTSLTGGVALSASTDVTVSTKAATGALPIALAVSVVVADAHVSVKDNASIHAAGDVTLAASGTVNVETVASSPSGGDEEEESGGTEGGSGTGGEASADSAKSASKSGGFFAVSVAIQDVSASITGNASVMANALRLNSESKQTVLTQASSNNEAENEQDGGEDSSQSLSGIVEMIKNLFGMLSGKGGSEPMVPEDAAGALDEASGQMAPEEEAGGEDSGGTEDEEDLGLGSLFNEEEPDGAGVTDTFDSGTSGATETNQSSGSSSSTQLVGALAVTYAGNANAAIIRTAGSILCTGEVSAEAIAEQGVRTIADGSPIEDGEAGGGDAAEEATTVSGGTITTANGETAGDEPEVSYGVGAEAPAITGGSIGADGTVTATGTTVVLDGVKITITGGKTIITNPTGIKKGETVVTVPAEPITITGGTTTVAAAKLTIKNATSIKITDGVLTITGGTVTMEGGDATGTGTFDIPSSDLEYTNVTIGDIDSFDGDVTDGLADSALPSGTTATGVKDKTGAAVNSPNLSTAHVEGGGAKVTAGTAAFSGTGITVKISGGNRSADGSTVTAANVEITGATLTITGAALTLTDGTVTGVKLADGTTASITGGVLKVTNGVLTIEGATIVLSVVRVTISGPDTGKTIRLSGGSVSISGGTATLTAATGTPATTTAITGGTATTDPVTPKKGSSSFAMGVGISVSVVRNTNTAYIEAGTLQAGSISVKAQTTLNSIATAKAGVSEGDIGIAGAAAVHVVSSKTNARLGSDATVAGGAVSVEASQKSKFTTSADATGGGEGTKVGVGAGLAIAVIGCDVNALIPDGIDILLPAGTDSIDELYVKATYEGNETLNATAGMTGGTSIVPVLALGISGVSTNAYLGTGTSPVKAAHDLLISADSVISRTMKANASASGSGVGFGAALSIGVFNDNTTARLNRSVAARNVSVKATATNSVTSNATAGVNGAKPKESESESGGGSGGSGGSGDADADAGSTDQVADRNVQGASNLAGSSGTKNVNSGAVNSLTSNRQTAQTGEGDIKIAAGFALNIQKNVVLASIGDGISITAIAEDGVDDSGAVAVQSVNKTDSEISANASATQSSIGVGVAVAINIVTYENIAEVGKSSITAKTLTVSALLPEEESEEEEEEASGPDTDTLAGKLESIVRQFVDDILSEMSDTIDLSKIFGADASAAISGFINGIITDVMNTLLEGTGLEGLFNGDIEQSVNEALASLQNLPNDAFNKIKNVVLKELVNKVKGMLSSGTPEDSGMSGLSTELQGVATELVTSLSENLVNIDELREMLKAPLVDTIKEKLTTIIEGLATDIANAAVGILAGWAGENAETPYGHTIKTEAVSGAGASKVGIAGAAAIAAVKGTTRASINSADSALSSDIVIAGAVIIRAESVHVIRTIASSAVGDNGKADENKNAASNANGDSAGGSTPATTASTPTTGADSGGTGTSPSTPNSAGSGKSVGVGASFAFNYIEAGVSATIGSWRSLTAATLVLEATLENKLATISVSGSDPLSGDTGADDTPDETADKAKDISVDASVAVGLIYNTVTAAVGANASITLTGGNAVNVSETEGDEYAEYVNLYIHAKEKGDTITRASGFTVGESTAVGAAVAINIASSDVSAAFAGTGVVTGAVKVLAHTYNEDDSSAIATAMGASLDRFLSKFRKAQGTAEEQTNNVLSGDYSGADTDNSGNQTAGTINGEINNNSNAEEGGTSTPANNNAPLSSNVLGSQDASTQTSNTSEGSNAVSSSASSQGTTGSALNVQPGTNAQQSQKIRVAAAVALNITSHCASSNISGSLTAAAVKVLATNNGNFMTLGTGAAISMEANGNSIGVGVAISVNKNEATATIGGSVTATGDSDYGKDVTADATLTQNMDGDYKGQMGAQALAGAVSGTGSKVSISGALAIIVSRAVTSASIASGAVINGGDISVTASDKSKLAVRAGGLSLSGGSSVGVGVSFALIYAHNTVSAGIGSGASITGDSLTLSAKKLKVDFSDYESALGMEDLLTHNETDDEEKGIVNINDETDENGDKSYSTEIRFSTDDALKVVSLLNFLSSTNYYAESISGAVNGGANGKLTASGSFAFVFFYNSTSATVGDGVSITLTGDMDVAASSETTARVIAGAVSVSSSKVGIGATVASVANKDTVTASVGAKGSGTGVDIGGALTVDALADIDIMMITVAAGATSTGTAVGGAIGVLVSENSATAQLADGAAVQADGGVLVHAKGDAFLLYISLSAAGSGGQAAAGGTFAVIVTGNSVKALVGKNARVLSDNGSIIIKAENSERLISILASLSGSTGGTGLAGTVNVQIARSTAQAAVGDGTTMSAKQNVFVDASSDTKLITIVAAASGSTGGAAIGATINVCVFSRSVLASVGSGCHITAVSGDIAIRAIAKDWLLTLTAAGAGSSSGLAISGSIPVVVGSSTVRAIVGESSVLTAGGSVGVIADLNSEIYVPAISVSLSGGSVSVGLTLSTVVLENLIEAIIAGGCTITANAATAGLDVPNRDTKRKGVIVSATANATMFLISVSGAASAGSGAGAGVVNTLVVRNTVRAQIRSRLRNTAGEETSQGEHHVETGGEVLVSAEDDSFILDIAGGMAASAGSVGFGATAVVLVFSKTVEASIGQYGTVNASGSVTVEAKSDDDLYLFAIAFGVASKVGVAGGVNVAVFQSGVTAALGGGVTAASVSVSATSDVTFVNTAASLAGGGTAGVAAVFIVSYLYGNTQAYISAGANLNASGLVSVSATSTETIVAVVVGGSGAGTAGVSGTVDLIIAKVITKAYTNANVRITAGSLSVTANDTFSLVGVAGSLSIGGTVGVGISAQVVLAFNTIEASIGKNNIITTNTGNVEVKATSSRNFDAYTVTAGGGGYVAVSGAVTVLVVGSQLTSDTSGVFVDSEGDNRIVPGTQIDSAFGQSNNAAKEYQGGAALGDMLNSNGSGSEDYDVNGSGFGSGGSSTTGADDNEKQANGTTDNMENASDGAAIGGSAPTYNLKDTTAAYIAAGTQVTSAGDITVQAQDTLKLDMVTGTIAISGITSVGAAISVAVLNGNVLAYVESGATLDAQGAIYVKALAGSEAVASDAAQSSRKNTLIDSAEAAPLLSAYTVRAITVSASGALVGVGIALSGVSLYTQTHAYMAGNVTGADSLEVTARSDYGSVLSITLALSGGGVAVNGSIALVVYQGIVEASICSAAHIANVPVITVQSFSNTTAAALATALGGGATAVNAASAIAVNLTRADTFIGQGVVISGSGSITVSADIDSGATATILSVAIGGGSFGATVAVAVLKPTVLTYIGVTPLDGADDQLEQSKGSGGSVRASGAVTVKNDVTGSCTATGLSFVAGASFAGNGTVVVAVNSVKGYAAINKANVTAGSIAVSALMDGDATVTAGAATIGSVALGLIIGVAVLSTDNRAFIDTTGAAVSAGTGSISVNAGRDGLTGTGQYDSTATVNVTTGAIGGVTANVNVALTINKSGNRALVKGTSGTLSAGSLTIYAKGCAQATTNIYGVSIGAINLALSVAIALLMSVQEASLSGGGTVSVGTLTVQSYQNTGKASNTFDASVNVFSGSGSLLSAMAFIAIVRAEAAGTAQAAAASLTVTGRITVQSYGRSYAGASISKVALDVVSVGIMYARAYARGSFGAYLGSDGASIGAGGVTVYTEYDAYAKADVNPAAGGFSASYAAVTGNVAQAEVNTTAYAAIVGTGTVSSSDTISVKVHGIANAYAIVRAAVISVTYAVNVAVNVATARLAAIQSAYIANATVRATVQSKGNVTVLSEYNATAEYESGNPKVPSITTDGAQALVGACSGGTNLTYSAISGTANVATANSASSSSAYIVGAATDILGTLRVESIGTSYANADTHQPSVQISLVGVAINTTIANAAGTYSAYIDSGTAGDIKAGAIAVHTRYNTSAVSRIAPGGGLSASISLVNVEGNVAMSDATTNASAYFTGAGKIASNSTIDVTARGTALADAATKSAEFTIGGVTLAANVAKATLSVTQSAYFTGTGTVTAKGNITVSSVYTCDSSHGAVATTGSPNPNRSGISLSIVNGQVNYAYARSLLSNTVTLGGNIDCDANISVAAEAASRAVARAVSSMSLSLLGFGSLYANAYSADIVQAGVASGAVIHADGNITVGANGDTYVYAWTDTPGSVSLANVSGARVTATVGSAAQRQTVKAIIGAAAKISAGGDITFSAFNDGYVSARISQGTNVSAVSISDCVVQTFSYYDTEVLVGDGAVVNAGGNIRMSAEDSPEARTSVTGTNIGIIVSSGNSYAANTIYQRVLASLGTGVSLSAGRGITVTAESNATMYAKTDANSGGLIDDATLKAYNTIASRDVDVEVKNGASLVAGLSLIESGSDILLQAQSGTRDSIYTCATGSGGGLVDVSSAEATSSVLARTDVVIGSGVIITDTFNTVTIAAYHGAGSIQTLGDFGAAGLSSNPRTVTHLSSFNSNAAVSIAVGAASDAVQTVITGRHVRIYSKLKNMYLYAYARAVTAGLHGTAKAYSTITTNMNNTITIGKAHIRSYDTMEIIASADPTSSGNNIYAYAGTKITAFVGRIVSEAIADGSINAAVTLGGDTDITGASVKVDVYKFAGKVSLTAYGKRRALASKSTTERDSISRGRSMSVSHNTRFHIGDGAAGIVIAIAADGTVHAVGIPGEKRIWTVTASTVTITQTIQNTVAGKLYVGVLSTLGDAEGRAAIYDQEYIPEITILNYSDRDLVIRGIDSYNETYSRPSVSGVRYYSLMNRSYDTTPVVTITSYGTGDVTLGNSTSVVANERGTTNISWVGDNGGGSLYVGRTQVGSLSLPSLWTHILNVTGAVNIGQSAISRFNAYLVVLGSEDGQVTMDASGSIYASLATAEIEAVDSLSASISDAALSATLLLSNIVADGATDIVLGCSVRMEYLAGAAAVSLVMPGALEYSADMVNIGNLTIADISRYLAGVNATDATLSYTLPNGMTVYTNESGKVLRIVSASGETSDFTNYQYSTNGSGELLLTMVKENVTINLSTGYLTVNEAIEGQGGESFETYITFYDGTWMIGGGSISVVKEYEEDCPDEANAWVLKDNLWKTVDGISYYLAFAQNVWNESRYYVVALDANDYVVGVYVVDRAKTTTSDVAGVAIYDITNAVGSDTYRDIIFKVTFSNFAGSGASLCYLKEVKLKNGSPYVAAAYAFCLEYNGAELTALSYDTISYDGSTYTRIADAAGLTGDAALIYNKLRGVIWKFTASKDSNTEYAGKVEYYSISNFSTAGTSTVSGGEGEDAYSYPAYVFTRSGVTHTLMVSDKFIYTLNGVEHELDVEIGVEIGSDGFPHIVGGAAVTLAPGESVRLYNEGDIYQVTPTLYVTKYGSVYLDGVVTVVDGHIHVAGDRYYNGNWGVYKNNQTFINTNDITASGAVTLYAGSVYLELLSSDVAVDAAGNYWWNNGTTWVAATYINGEIKVGTDIKLTITEEDGITYYILPSGFTLGSDGSIVLPGDVSETAQMREIGAGTGFKMGYIEGASVTIEMLGAKDSLVDDDTSDVDIRTAGAAIVRSASEGSIGTVLNPLEIVCGSLRFENLSGEDTLETDTYLEAAEGGIVLGGGLAQTVDGAILVVRALAGSISGSDLYVTNAADVTLDAFTDICFDNVTVDLASVLTLLAGEDMDMLEQLDVADSTITFTAAGSITIDTVSMEDSSAGLTATAGDIHFGSVSLTGGVTSMTAGGSIRCEETTDVDGGALAMNAVGDIRFGTVTMSGSVATMTAGGDILCDGEWSAAGDILTLDAGGDIAAEMLRLTAGADVTMTAAGGIRFETLNAQGSTLSATAGGDIAIETIRQTNSGVTLESTDGQIRMPDITAQGGTLSATAQGDILLDELYAAGSGITLVSTDGGIYTEDGESYIKVEGATSTLTLSALDDIGTALVHIRLDIPAEVKLHILHVDDYFIDAMHIPVPADPMDPVYTGIDADGNPVSNDGEIPNDYVGAIGSETVALDFDTLTPEQWAQRLMAAMTREQWLALVAEGSVRDLIIAGSIDAATLATYLFDNTITAEALTAKLSVAHDTPEWQNTLLWLDGIEAQLRALLVSTEGLTPTKKNKKVITDDMEQALLAQLLVNNAVGELSPGLVLTPEELAQFAADIAERLAAQAAATADSVSQSARALNILVGESTGCAWVTNEGDIHITQQQGNMTVGIVDSKRGDVALTTLDTAAGDIRGAATSSTHVEGRYIALSAAGNIGGAGHPLVIDSIDNRLIAVYNVLATRFIIRNTGTVEVPAISGHIESDVRFDWLRTYDCDAATRLDATAGGSIVITEARGNLGLGIISAGGSVTLAAPGSISDVRSASETSKNVTASQLEMTAAAGAVGAADQYIETAIAGGITVRAQGDIFVDDTGDMTMTADSAAGEVSARAERNLTLANTAGNLRIGKLVAGGFARVTSMGSIVEGNRRGAAATIAADGMVLVAAGEIGTAANPFEVDTGSGTFSADAASLVLTEVSGDLHVKSVVTDGDCILVVPGSIFDVNGTEWDDALAAQHAANDAINAADEAQATASVLQDYADRIKAILDAADAAAAGAQTALDSANAAIADIAAKLAVETDAAAIQVLNKQLKTVNDSLVKLTKTRDEALAAQRLAHDTYDAPWAAAQAEADAAQGHADALRTGANTAQAHADALRQLAEAADRTVRTGGDLSITAGGSVGEAGHALSVHADGTLSIAAGGSVYLSGGSVTQVAGIHAGGDVVMTMLGSIIAAAGAAGPVITGSGLSINSLWDDIGEAGNPLHVSVSSLSAVGANLYLYNDKPLTVDEVFVQGSAGIEVDGDVNAGSGDTNIHAGELDLDADGDIGSKGDKLGINVARLTAQGDSVYLDSIAETLRILALQGRTIDIDASGNVMGGNITTGSITIDAFGSVGSKEDPLGIFTNGSIRLTSVKGLVYYINTMKAHYRHWQARQLESHYLAAFVVKIPFSLRQRGGDAAMAVYAVIGLKEDGTWDIMGLWVAGDVAPETAEEEKAEALAQYAAILDEIKLRGVERIDVVFLDGLTGWDEAFAAAYPDAAQNACALVWVANADTEIAEEDYDAFIADLGAVYAAGTQDEAQRAYEQFLKNWENQYPDAAAALKAGWQQWMDGFDDMQAARTAGFDIVLMAETITGMNDAVGERYANGMDAIYAAFIEVLGHFPQY